MGLEWEMGSFGAFCTGIALPWPQPGCGALSRVKCVTRMENWGWARLGQLLLALQRAQLV